MTVYTDKEIAAVAWAANAELQALHGDPAPSLPGDAEDSEAHAVTVAGIRAILDGATPEQLHETWMRSREAQGWTYGPRKDSRLKTHPALVPYADLPEHQRVKDRVFTAIVQAMSAQDDDAGRHPDDCRCQFCREDIREAQAQDDADDFVQDRHTDLDPGENGGAMTDADYYDLTAEGGSARDALDAQSLHDSPGADL